MDEANDSKELQEVKPKTIPIIPKENLLKSPSKSKDDICCICLGKIKNVCAAETCLHRFCLECLTRWSKVKNNCPLCKTKLETILHDIKSDSDYKRYVVAQAAAPDDRFVIRPEGPEEEPRRGVHSVSNRTRIYREGLWVQYPSVGRERVRLCNPAFYREREGLTHRLIPWVKRELKALDVSGRFVFFIIELLSQYEIMSRGFHSAVHKLLTHRTSHFQHEFNCFAHSIYDMIGYDNVTQNRYGSYQIRIGPPYLLNVEDEENDEEDIHFVNSESIEIDLTQEPNPMDDVNAGSSRSYDECVCNHDLEIVSSISSSSTDNSNQTMYSVSSSFPQTPVIISSESDSVILSTPNPSHQKKRRKKSVSQRNEESSTTILNQEIENIVISSDDEEFGESTNYKRKKSKSKRNSQFQSGSSSHISRRRERKDHPSKIKSSKKIKFNFMKSSKS